MTPSDRVDLIAPLVFAIVGLIAFGVLQDHFGRLEGLPVRVLAASFYGGCVVVSLQATSTVPAPQLVRALTGMGTLVVLLFSCARIVKAPLPTRSERAVLEAQGNTLLGELEMDLPSFRGHLDRARMRPGETHGTRKEEERPSSAEA